MNPNSIYSGSSLVIIFNAKDNQGASLDISGYEKRVIAFTGSISKLTPEITPINPNSFSIELTGEETKRLGSGALNIVIELKKGKDERTGKACPLTLMSPNSSNCASGNLVMDSGSFVVDLRLESTSVSFELLMGTTIINQGGGSGGDIPTKVSQLENDKGYITADDIPSIPTKLSELENDKNYVTSGDIPEYRQVFIDMFEQEGGVYNRETKLFELNGLTDITYGQALAIYARTGNIQGKIIDYRTTSNISNSNPKASIRTNLPAKYFRADVIDLNLYMSDIEVLNLTPYMPLDYTKTTTNNSFNTSNLYYCLKLKTIIGVLDSTNWMVSGHTSGYSLPELITVNIWGLKISTQLFKSAPKISLDSLVYLVSNSAASSPIVVVVHADVYAKLTNASLYPQWAALVTTALSKNITFAV